MTIAFWNTGELGPNEVSNYSGGAANPAESELHNAAVEPVCRKYLELRYRLLPYLYSAVHEGHANCKLHAARIAQPMRCTLPTSARHQSHFLDVRYRDPLRCRTRRSNSRSLLLTNPARPIRGAFMSYGLFVWRNDRERPVFAGRWKP